MRRGGTLIGQSYFLRLDPKLWRARQPYPPLGALYAAAALRAAGEPVAFFDAMLARDETAWIQALDRHQPDVAVLYEDNFNYLTKMCLLRMREAGLRMIDACAARGVPVLVAGSDATDHPAVYLARGAAAIIAGEGEATLPEAVAALRDSREALRRVPGLVVGNGEGLAIRTLPRAAIRDLDALPRPAWDLVDVAHYRRLWRRHHGYFSMHVATTRGCPYHCNWCAKPIYGQRYTARTPSAVVDEIAWLRATYRPDHLWIADDIFGLRPGWIEEFAELVTSRRVVTPFKCLLRADGVSETVASALARAGCDMAWIGAESGSQRILDAMEKGIRVGQIVEATRRLRRENVGVGFFLQFGYPGEGWDDIAKTLEMVRACRPDDIGVSVSYPLPGTPFYDRVRAGLGPSSKWMHSGDLAMMHDATFSPAFYRVLHGVVHAELRASRSFDRAPSGRGPRPRATRARRLLHGLVATARLPLLRRRLREAARRDVRDPAASTDAVAAACALEQLR